MPDIGGRCRPAKAQATFQPLSTGQGNFLLLVSKFEIMVGVCIIVLYLMDMMTFGRNFNTDHPSFGKRSDVVIEPGRPVGHGNDPDGIIQGAGIEKGTGEEMPTQSHLYRSRRHIVYRMQNPGFIETEGIAGKKPRITKDSKSGAIVDGDTQ